MIFYEKISSLFSKILGKSNIYINKDIVFDLEFESLSDIGTTRSNNEDAVFIYRDLSKNSLLAIVADGMGGHASGEVASSLAINTIESLFKRLDINTLTEKKLLKFLNFVISSVNKRIWDYAKLHSETLGMGTTLCLLFIINNKMFWGWVGDSRIYIWRSKNLVQLTKDDTFVNRLLDDGIITKEQAKTHPNSHLLTQALGTNETLNKVNLCVGPIELADSDRLILTTDGVHESLSRADFEVCLKNKSPHIVANLLIETSKSLGSADNLSVIVIDINNTNFKTKGISITRDYKIKELENMM